MAKWHFLFLDRSLTAYEKLVGAAYAARQRKDNWLPIAKEVIAADCSISVRQVERCKRSLEHLGILLRKVERTPSGDMITLYRIIQRQELLFEKKAKRPPGQATISRIYPKGQNLKRKNPALRSSAQMKELADKKKIEARERRERYEAEIAMKQAAVLSQVHVGLAPRPSPEWYAKRGRAAD